MVLGLEVYSLTITEVIFDKLWRDLVVVFIVHSIGSLVVVLLKCAIFVEIINVLSLLFLIYLIIKL